LEPDPLLVLEPDPLLVLEPDPLLELLEPPDCVLVTWGSGAGRVTLGSGAGREGISLAVGERLATRGGVSAVDAEDGSTLALLRPNCGLVEAVDELPTLLVSLLGIVDIERAELSGRRPDDEEPEFIRFRLLKLD
jgi:hypothetical protein